jgi:16S rRNA (cytosine967-C5)-methyltransferase
MLAGTGKPLYKDAPHWMPESPMTPAARLQMAIDILEAMDAQPIDRFLKSWFAARRFAGSKDRRAVADRVFALERRRAQLAHRMGQDTPRARLIAALLEEGADIEALFTGGYAPAPLTAEERAAIAATPPPAPRHIRGEYPLWLEAELARAFGERLEAETAALQHRAPADLRVNTLKAAREDVIAALGGMGIAAAATPFAPQGLRITGDAGALMRSPLFESGAFEFQDEAAQIAALLVDARPGMAVLDMAAGAGGKSLALAAAMENRGVILASDVREKALAELRRRAARAGATIITTGDAQHRLFDRVLLDAPCSGSGTWRRQPELRWRLSPARLGDLMALQDRLLDEAAVRTAPGGVLFYATCSILPCENGDRAAGFLARHPGFRRQNLGEIWDGLAAGPRLPGLEIDFHASPAATGTDGFYGAAFRKER